ncbi:MAG: hypothetical protein H0X16_01735 [Chloroflexi bacterium]|nr:hypothetical protein [Chloroflexota bacterium]
MHPTAMYTITKDRLAAYEREAEHDRLVRTVKAASQSRRSPSDSVATLRDLRRVVLRRLLGDAATA